MKKTRWMMLLLATVWMSLLLESTVMAWTFKSRSETDYRVYALKPDTVVNAKNYYTFEQTYDKKTEETVYTDVYNQYKLVIPADGYIRVNMKGRNNSGSMNGFRKTIAYYRKHSYELIPIYFSLHQDDIRAGKNIIPINKGTYYIDVSFTGDGTDTLPFSYSFKKVAFPANHSRAKAQTLKRGRKIEICQLPKKNYNRWFKIKLTKKQAITFWSDQGDNVVVFNEDLERLSTKRAGEKSIKYSTTQKLPKGTYYLKMKRAKLYYIDSDDSGCYYTTLYWK